MEFEDDQNNQEGDHQGAVDEFFQEYENEIVRPDPNFISSSLPGVRPSAQ